MKKIKLTTTADCCDRLARALRIFRNAHKTSTILRDFSAYLTSNRVCNAKEARRLFYFFASEGILTFNGARYSWDVKEEFFTIDKMRSIIVDGDIASVYGNHGHKRVVKPAVEEVKEEVKEEKNPDVAYCGITISKQPYNILKDIITDDLVKELHNRGYEVSITYKK